MENILKIYNFKYKVQFNNFIREIIKEFKDDEISSSSHEIMDETQRTYNIYDVVLQLFKINKSYYDEPEKFIFSTKKLNGDECPLTRTETFRPYFFNKKRCKWETWSYTKCFNPETNLQKIKKAFRSEVNNQIEIFRSLTSKKCAVCFCSVGEYHGNKEYDVDHVGLSFKTILENYCDEMKIDLSTLDFYNDQYSLRYRLSDELLLCNWIDYHEHHAELQILCIDCHRNKSNDNEL